MAEKIEISHRTIIFTVLFLIGIWFLYQIRHVILAIFISVIFMSALNPTIDRLERFKLPRWVAIALVYIGILGIIGGVLAFIIPALVEQSGIFVNRLISFLRLFDFFGVKTDIIASQISQLSSIPANILKFAISLFSNLLALLAFFVITFYLLLERRNLDRYLVALFGKGNQAKAKAFVDRTEKKLGGWVRGQVALMTIVGLLTYVGLLLLGMEFALPLAILAGLLEIIPNLGPLIAAVPAVLIGLGISFWSGVAVAALYFLVQQIENTLIVPKVMQRAAGVNPLVTILALAIGFKIAGVVGAILAVPLFLIIQVAASEIFSSKRFQNL